MKRSNLLAQQGRRPSGLLGHIVGRIMAGETREANRVALERLELKPDDRLLEVGFGHGATLAAAALVITQGSLSGVDFSAVMLDIARRRNARLLRSGRLDLVLGASDHLPYEAGRFTKALAVHTIYFWSHPERDLAEIHRVLSPDGRLVIGYKPREDEAFVRDFPAEVYHIRSQAEVEGLIASAGFQDVTTLSRQVGYRVMAWTGARKS